MGIGNPNSSPYSLSVPPTVGLHLPLVTWNSSPRPLHSCVTELRSISSGWRRERCSDTALPPSLRGWRGVPGGRGVPGVTNAWFFVSEIKIQSGIYPSNPYVTLSRESHRFGSIAVSIIIDSRTAPCHRSDTRRWKDISQGCGNNKVLNTFQQAKSSFPVSQTNLLLACPSN